MKIKGEYQVKAFCRGVDRLCLNLSMLMLKSQKGPTAIWNAPALAVFDADSNGALIVHKTSGFIDENPFFSGFLGCP